MSKFLLDTWAWIEYYEGSEIGKDVSRILENHNCYTSRASIAELSDNFHRKDVAGNYSWQDVFNHIASKTEIIQITNEIASEAGKINAREKEKQPDFGLMDAIILATAREKNLELLTGDPHLADKETAEDLR